MPEFRTMSFRVTSDLHSAIVEIVDANNLTLSEYVRGLIIANISRLPPGSLLLGDVEEGYKQARALASNLAYALLQQAQETLPASYEEARARYGNLAGPGKGARAQRR